MYKIFIYNKDNVFENSLTILLPEQLSSVVAKYEGMGKIVQYVKSA